jgi:hypothetical protein
MTVAIDVSGVKEVDAEFDRAVKYMDRSGVVGRPIHAGETHRSVSEGGDLETRVAQGDTSHAKLSLGVTSVQESLNVAHVERVPAAHDDVIGTRGQEVR